MRFRIKWVHSNHPITQIMTLRTAQEAARVLVTAGFSQEVIARRANVKQPTISRILSGEHKDPKSSVTISLNAFVDEVGAQAPAKT
jgi:predicted transcriptional regulator